MKYDFERDEASGVIFVTVLLDGKYAFKMLLDTGASHTTIDLTPLYMNGYRTKTDDISRPVEIANGIIEVTDIQVKSLSAFGHTKQDVTIQACDFFAHGILADYDGVLGLDFFDATVFTVDMKNKTIEV